MTDNLEPPKQTVGDYAHAVARATLDSLPYIGAAAAELFQMVVTPSLERRRNKWMNEVADALRGLLEKERCRIEDLASDERFVDVLLQATSTAMRTTREEKLAALRNAVLNSALPNPPEESRQQMFVQWVDSLSVWHLRILRLLADPSQWFQENNRCAPQYSLSSSLSRLLTDAYPELKDQRDLYDQLAKDLYDRGLINTNGLHVMMSASGAFDKRATKLGEQFLRFIAAPVA